MYVCGDIGAIYVRRSQRPSFVPVRFIVQFIFPDPGHFGRVARVKPNLVATTAAIMVCQEKADDDDELFVAPIRKNPLADVEAATPTTVSPRSSVSACSWGAMSSHSYANELRCGSCGCGQKDLSPSTTSPPRRALGQRVERALIDCCVTT